MMFAHGFYIKKTAFNSLRRLILNQHVLLEFGALAGLAGGIIGSFIQDFPSRYGVKPPNSSFTVELQLNFLFLSVV